MVKNINTKEYWDNLYRQEGGAWNNWRTYPEKFGFILSEFDINDKKILELGCGVGVFAVQLHPSHYFGIDISEAAINEIKNIGLDGKAAKLPPIPKLNFVPDIVIGLEFLEHIDNKPRLQLIKEVSGLIGKNGKAIFSVPDNSMPPEEVPEHRIVYTKKTFMKFLKNAFLKVEIYQITSRASRFTGNIYKFLIAKCSNK